ncbi:hypothetical protein SKAU_G00041060 [Synaphobranchus kaupii]|uniref:Beta-1,4-N-acetylgalactosaminyltransferase n=1 Tax=Synaphobranchus kaupii TaxID=118154 RepID=A0A9Q1G1J0_SYNKA|nr:hypothetical protein SKAU_G00041060 [Synaphobranchus kaupii]
MEPYSRKGLFRLCQSPSTSQYRVNTLLLPGQARLKSVVSTPDPGDPWSCEPPFLLVLGVGGSRHKCQEFKVNLRDLMSRRMPDFPEFSAWDETATPNRLVAARESLGSEEGRAWQSQFTPQSWRPEYKGQANLHIFEDWCGGSTLQLRKNLHFPLYPHSRTTVKKLAVSPRWTNYGLRIFGYLHPYVDGEYLFAVASDDNSEFWFSLDDSPLNLRLLALVGKSGREWTAPGEFGKYASQTSQPVQLMRSKRYYFEILHKQNGGGTDHVEVAWRLPDGQRFTVIDSHYISLYTNESALLMSEVSHIPQSAASHVETPTSGDPSLGPDMLREDPRDSLYQVPLVDGVRVRRVLPNCAYKPSYIIKGFPLLRYQGLQFVHMSYVYPNDYTRLTHMESENTCFYHENPEYLDRFGFFKYMKMDVLGNGGFEDEHRSWNQQDIGLQENISIDDIFQYVNPEINQEPKPGVTVEKAQERSNNSLDYGDDYDDYTFKRRRKLFFVPPATGPAPHRKRKRRGKGGPTPPSETAQKLEPAQQKKDDPGTLLGKKARRSGVVQIPGITSSLLEYRRGSGTPKAKEKETSRIRTRTSQPNQTQNQTTAPPSQEVTVTTLAFLVPSGNHLKWQSRGNVTTPQFKMKATTTMSQWREGERRAGLQGNGLDERAEPEVDSMTAGDLDTVADRSVQTGEEVGSDTDVAPDSEADAQRSWELEATNQAIFEQAVNWRQTFDVEPLDFHALRSDWIDLSCNVSGNLLLDAGEASAVADGFMRKLHLKNPGRFTLSRVLNVEKRSDGTQGSRYLLELELQEEGVGHVRLSQYIYALQRRRRPSRTRRRTSPQEPLLCTPLGFAWDPWATVHFIVPVKNQARWVRQFISDMERLYRDTGDSNFNIVITDYSSNDMDVEEALRHSALPRYQYLKLKGNFERSAGLQAGIDLITDDHSILFLCDLHIHFPPFIIDSIRKHCVEGKMAFAPIVMRLDCGATRQEAKGFWEVNGFGLLGIYKSDLDAAGGMNTRDFRERWGGEDWELLDRILQSGLEVERIHLRNFMHHFHSKRGMWNRQPLKPT